MVPAEPQLWQDPVPKAEGPQIGVAAVAELTTAVRASGLSIADLVFAAWSSASTFRGTDKRGGANGARIRLAPQKDWAVNEPARLAQVLATLEVVQADFNQARAGGEQISLADLIVLAGNVGIEDAAQAAGIAVHVPFVAGRTDASQEMTDVESFAVLEPVADGFRNHRTPGSTLSDEELLIERARLLTLTAPEMVVLLGGLRGLGITAPGTQLGVFTDRPGTLTNDFFVNLLDMTTTWQSATPADEEFEGRDRRTGAVTRRGSRVDLILGSNSQLRAIAEVYASSGQEKFVADFVAAWVKVMQLDRFDLARR
jgi:catalase-peroxidase